MTPQNFLFSKCQIELFHPFQIFFQTKLFSEFDLNSQMVPIILNLLFFFHKYIFNWKKFFYIYALGHLQLGKPKCLKVTKLSAKVK